MRPILAQALVHCTRKHARVLTTPAADAPGPAAASLPDQAEALHAGAAERPEQQAQYWRVVQRLAAVGWTEDAVALLGLHSAWQLAYSGARNPQMLSVVRFSPHSDCNAPSCASTCLESSLRAKHTDACMHAGTCTLRAAAHLLTIIF
jgi:hypothetical protein